MCQKSNASTSSEESEGSDTVYPWQTRILTSPTTRTSISSRVPSTTTTSTKPGNQLTFERFEQTISPITESSVREIPALVFRGPDSNGGLTTPEDNSSSRLSGLSGLSNQNTYSWKTLRDYCQTTEDVPSRKSSIHFGTVGTWDRGAVSTARHSCLKRESASTLSDVLETNPAEHFYLSQTTLESLIRHAARHQKRGDGFGAILLTPYSRETVRVVQCNTSSSPASPNPDGEETLPVDTSGTSTNPCSP